MLKLLTLQPWHKNAANGPGIRRAIRMAANVAEYGTDIQAGAATYAMQYFPFFLAGEQTASPIVDQHHMKLFRTIGFTRPSGSANQCSVRGDWLPRSRCCQHRPQCGQIFQPGYNFFYASYSN